jgi:hypothetical protein
MKNAHEILKFWVCSSSERPCISQHENLRLTNGNILVSNHVRGQSPTIGDEENTIRLQQNLQVSGERVPLNLKKQILMRCNQPVLSCN